MAKRKPAQVDANALVALRPGQRVAYKRWRGDRGTGVFLAHARETSSGYTVPLEDVSPLQWPAGSKFAGVRIQRDGFVGTTLLFPFLGDGDSLETCRG